MNIQPINNQTFTARVKIQEIQTAFNKVARETKEFSPGCSTASSGLSTVSSFTTGSTASNMIGSGSDIIGSAFSSKATGVNSSGIVPSVLGSATPETVVSANNHPSLIGSVFSTIGSLFQRPNVNIKVKNPS